MQMYKKYATCVFCEKLFPAKKDMLKKINSVKVTPANVEQKQTKCRQTQEIMEKLNSKRRFATLMESPGNVRRKDQLYRSIKLQYRLENDLAIIKNLGDRAALSKIVSQHIN